MVNSFFQFRYYVGISLVFQFLFLVSISGEAISSRKCETLTFDGVLTCTSPNRDISAGSNSCTGAQKIGTIAKYKCKPHFVYYDVNSPENSNLGVENADNDHAEAEGEMRCTGNGSWSGHDKFKSFRCIEDCGKRVSNPKPLIVNGVATNHTDWPWHALLFRRERGQYICGGSIITKSTILTAAHCVTTVTGEKISPNTTLVVLGGGNTNFTENLGRPNVQIIQVKEIYISEYYDPKKEYQADIAVLHLHKNIEYSDNISPVCLPHPTGAEYESNSELLMGKIGDVVGFGVDESGKTSSIIKHGKLEIKSHADCFIKLQRILTDSQFCAENEWVTVCNGDSGGALVLPSVIYNRFYIHGIVSSGEPLNPETQVCENYAVFTQVNTFAAWIRDVVKRIDGSGDFGFTRTFPYVQRESEARRATFNPITNEWKNRVASIELSHVDIEPDALFKFLEYSRTARSMNLTAVKFLKDLPNRSRRSHLPELKNFNLDVLTTDSSQNSSSTSSRLLEISKAWIRSLLFFEKSSEDANSDSESDIAYSLTRMDTNLNITTDIYRLVEVNHEEGKLVLGQIPFSNEILSNLPTDFKLQHLALSGGKYNLNFSTLSNQIGLRTLVLNQVGLTQGFDAGQLGGFLKKLNRLQELVLAPKDSALAVLELGSVPVAVKHLALTNVILTNLDGSTSVKPNNERPKPINALSGSQAPSPRPLNPSSILFPDTDQTRSISKRETDSKELPFGLQARSWKVEIFYCNLCLHVPIDFATLSKIFPKLRILVLKFRNWTEISIPDNILSSFPHLEQVFLSFSTQNSNSTISRKYSKANGILKPEPVQPWDLAELDYKLNRRDNFYTSEAEYATNARLTFAERHAFATGHYRFDGHVPLLPDGSHPLIKYPAESTFRTQRILPQAIQERLETFEIANAEVLREAIEGSLTICSRLKYLRFLNVSSPDYIFRVRPELPSLEEYAVDSTTSPVIAAFGYRGLEDYHMNVYDLYFPFTEIGVSYKTTLLKSRLRRMRILCGDCILLSWNSESGNLITSSGHINDWLKHDGEKVKRLAVKFWELDYTVVPTNITHLNLNFIVLPHPGNLFRRLNSLQQLKYASVRLKDADDYKDWEWSTLNLEDLAGHTKTLKSLAFENTHLVGNSPQFDSVRLVYFENCTYPKEFAENFNQIFPNVEKLVLFETGNTSKTLVEAMKSKTIKWILSSSNFTSKLDEDVENTVRSDSEKLGISKYFILERVSKSESWMRRNADPKKVEKLMQGMKGRSAFGNGGQCHAYTFAEYAEGIRMNAEMMLARAR